MDRRQFNVSDSEEGDKIDTEQIFKTIGSRSTLITPLDIDNDGRLDIVVQDYSTDGVPFLKVIYNNFYFDKFFIKALMFNDLEKDIPTDQEFSKSFKESLPSFKSSFGESTINIALGASFRYVVTNL